MTYDVAIIGAGPGGYVTAVRCAQYGLKVCIIEKSNVGGTCLNSGCIPTKTLIASAKKYEMLKTISDYGVFVDNYSIDFDFIMSRKDNVVAKLRNGVKYLLKKNGIDVFNGKAKLISPTSIAILGEANTEIHSKNIIISTGSLPYMPNTFLYDGDNILTSDDILELVELPDSLLIIGGGVIGCEMAYIFSSFGVKVTVIDKLQNILPMEDEEIVNILKECLIQKGIEIITGISINEVAAGNGCVIAALSDGNTLEAEKALVSIGRIPNTKDLGLENTGVTLGQKGEILVNTNFETAVPGIYAIGDVTGKTYLAHAASAQGLAVADLITGKVPSVNNKVIPRCIYTFPEIASVGLTEKEAIDSGFDISVGRFPFKASGMGTALGETVGLVKVVAEKKSGILLGTHIIGSCASELIPQPAIILAGKGTLNDLTRTVYAHPTMSEAIHEAFEAVLGKSINY